MILYNVLAKKTALGRLNFFPGSIKNIHFDGATPVLTLGLIVHNTSGQKMVLRSLSANLYANKTYIGNGSTFEETEVLPNAQGTLFIDVRLSPLSIVNDLIRAVQFGSFEQDLQFQGYANVDNYQIPIDLNFKAGG